MGTLALTAEQAVLHQIVGTEVFLQGRDLLERGQVAAIQWDPANGRAFGQVGGSHSPHSAIATLVKGAGGGVVSLLSHCTCRAPSPCPHAVALVLAALSDQEQTASDLPGAPARPGAPAVVPRTPAQPAAWERSLGGLIGIGGAQPAAPSRPESEPAEVALQFEIIPTQSGTGRSNLLRPAFRIGLRPVVPGRTGNWVRTGISWSHLEYDSYYGSARIQPRHRRLLVEIMALAVNGEDDRYYGYHDKTLYLETISSRRIWDLLAESVEVGLPLLQVGKREAAVVLHPDRARVEMRVRRSDAGLDLEPVITVGADQVLSGASMLLGEPAHGIAWWQSPGEAEPAPKDRVLRLAPLAGPLDPQVQSLFAAGRIQIPARDEDRFVREYYPALRRRLPLVAVDESVQLPQALPPVLVLRVERLDGHRLRVTWHWSYALGQARREEPLWPVAASADRDAAAESAVLRAVTAVVRDLPELSASLASGPRLAPESVLSGMAMIAMVNQVLPALAQVPDLELVLDLDGVADTPMPDYREAEFAPVVTFSGSSAEGDRDWFDLAISVTVDGQSVPFNELFVALVQGQTHLILSSGTYFSLDVEEFRQLATLIAEARALQDAPPGTPGGLRLSRFQAGLWEELEQIGVVSGQAAAWQESVRALSRAGELVRHPVPTGLKAELRPYQLEGFHWLAALFTLGLGGVLADDMGLGKTLQALALICHAREQQLTQAPFLVIAPTSVVFNWASEVARFAPDLKVAAISETEARRGGPLAEAIAGADIVVTSYTLFRLEYAEYAAVDWAGLILDEAQFVKNHQSRSYSCVKMLPAPFKLAITGTPMENNLMELWSLMSITAPGLFANPTRFTEYYRTPIEKNADADLLAQLRRRIKPLMLRRTKQQVATDLPDKQEQVIELELNPKHRRVYQTHLQRERQKVLGLLGDLAKNRFEIFRSLTLLRQASLDVGLIDAKYAKIPSTKLDAMMEQVADIVEEGHRTLIFSQFTRFLDLARRRLDEAGIDYCYLDGTTRNRGAVLTEFKTGTAPVFLISLKAGGFGLNLTEADYCILLDPWWNPATEAQAVDRVHRIGQTSKVMVYRLVAKDTIEEKVMALKAKKAALFESVMDGDAFESAALSVSDIRSLLE